MSSHPPEADAAPVLELAEVSFRRGQRTILHDITFTVNAGEHWALIGPNGAGKSTILSMCGASNHPTSGTVRVLGDQLGRVELQALRRSIGHVNPRHPLNSPLPVREVVLTGLTGTTQMPPRWQPSDDQLHRADELIEQLDLIGKADEKWPTLSQGERGRALIARALIGEPQLLLLDEPSTGLDIASREHLLSTIDALETSHPSLASVMVTHHLEELPASTTHAVLFADGAIVAAGRAPEVLTTEHVTAAFDYPINVNTHDGRWFATTSHQEFSRSRSKLRREPTRAHEGGMTPRAVHSARLDVTYPSISPVRVVYAAEGCT